MLSHGDKNMILARHRFDHGENIILTLRPKVKVIQGSWMYVTHRPMVIHSCANVKGCGLNTKACQQSCKFDRASKVNIVSGSHRYRDVHCMRHIISWWRTHVPNMVSQFFLKTNPNRVISIYLPELRLGGGYELNING